MNDEKYFWFDGDNMPGSARFYTHERMNNKAKISDDVPSIGKEKYHKILMLIVISNRTMSKT